MPYAAPVLINNAKQNEAHSPEDDLIYMLGWDFTPARQIGGTMTYQTSHEYAGKKALSMQGTFFCFHLIKEDLQTVGKLPK